MKAQGISLNAEERCARLPFKTMPVLPQYFIPVDSKTLVVKQGQSLYEGQVINNDTGDNLLSHSPVNGVFQEIQNVHQQEYLVIQSTKTETPVSYNLQDPFIENPKKLIDKVRKAGIIGMGGAGFPTYKKLLSAKDNVSILIINSVECEPFLSGDLQLLFNKTKEILQAAKVLCYITGASEIVIAIHKNKELSQHLSPFLEKQMTVIECPNHYPAGYEKLLIQEVTGKELSTSQLPTDAGVIVQNTATLLAIYDALFYNKPLIERSLTVDGAFCAEYGNFIVKIGTPISAFMRPFADYDAYMTVSGGPMMGQLTDKIHAVNKTMNGILIFEGTADVPEVDCIYCAKCVDHCPIRLEPFRLIDMIRHEEWDTAQQHGTTECIACNVCTYVCPSHIPLGSTIFTGRRTITAKLREGSL